MIITALNEYYNECIESNKKIAPFGFSEERLSFLVILREEGAWDIEDVRDSSGKKPIPARYIVPSLGKRLSIGVSPNFFWGSANYVFGISKKSNHKRVEKCFNGFKEFHKELIDNIDDEILHRMLVFLENFNANIVKERDDIDNILSSYIAFAYEDHDDNTPILMSDRPLAREAWINYRLHVDLPVGQCLSTGKIAPITLLHQGIAGIRGGQARSSLISFNTEAFIHHGKKSNLNAPISLEVSHGYTTALNYLLNPSNKRVIYIANDTIVFWSNKNSRFDDYFYMMNSKNDDEAEAGKLRAFLESVKKGKLIDSIDEESHFNILVLTSSISRIAVRFFYQNSVKNIVKNLKQHYNDIAIDGLTYIPSLWSILSSTLRNGENLSKISRTQLPSQLLKSTLTGTPYPQSLQASIINRIKIEGGISPLRAAMLKAYLIRSYNYRGKESCITMSLNYESKEVSYLLGRLLAVIGRDQYLSNPGSNTKTASSLFAFAAATPNAAFRRLLAQEQHYKRQDSLVGEILFQVEEIPKTLNLEEQTKFMLGYYHQRQEFFNNTKEKKDESN
jgi:CRISPR-associated protein Csd1